MTTYHFSGTVAWNRLGSFITTGRGVSTKSITDPSTGLVPAGLTQGGVAVTKITADRITGQWSFTTTDVPGVMMDWGAGPNLVGANELPGMILTAAAPTDSAVATLVTSSSSSRTAMDARYRNLEPVNVWAYGAVGDGSTDDTTAVQAAINAAGVGGTVYLGKGTFGTGRFKCGKITLLDYQTLTGDLSSITNTGVPKNELYFGGLSGRTVTDGVTTNTSTTITSATAAFTSGDVGSLVQGPGVPKGAVIASVTNSTTAVLSIAATATGSSLSLSFSPVAVTLGIGCTLRSLEIRGPGSTSSTVGSYTASAEATYDQIHWLSFGIGSVQVGTFYSRFDRCGWRSNATGLLLAGCYNVSVTTPRFACMNETNTAWGVGIETGTVRPLSIHGGSIESYGSGGGIKVTGNQSHIDLFGVYFESSSATTSPVGVLATSLGTGVSVTAMGCMVYLDAHAYWMNFASSVVRVVSKGNRFNCASGSSTTPSVYLGSSGFITGELGPDDWNDVVKASVGFDGFAGVTPGLTIQRPKGFTAPAHADVVMQGRAIVQTQKTVTSNYTVTGDDYTIIANGSSITVTLPDPLANMLKGRRYVVKNINASSLTVNCSPGTRLIDGATSQTLTQWQSITVETDFATGYNIVAKV